MVDCVHSCGGYGSAGEQPERRHEAEDRAELKRLCSLLSALFSAESAKLISPAEVSPGHWAEAPEGVYR